MNSLEALLQATERCTKQIQAMIPLEQTKRKALISDDVSLMKQMMCEQQAAVMELSNLEQQRLQCQTQAGFSGLTAAEILQRMPEAQKTRLEACFAELRSAAATLKLYNQKATELAKASMQFWETQAKRRSVAATRTTYSPHGSRPANWQEGSTMKIKI